MHALNPCDASLQLDNMMVHGFWPWPTIKLCDFGFAKDEARQSACDTSCGTPEYIAPEASGGALGDLGPALTAC